MVAADASQQLTARVALQGTAYLRHATRGTSNGDEAEFKTCATQPGMPKLLCGEDGDPRPLRDQLDDRADRQAVRRAVQHDRDAQRRLRRLAPGQRQATAVRAAEPAGRRRELRRLARVVLAARRARLAHVRPQRARSERVPGGRRVSHRARRRQPQPRRVPLGYVERHRAGRDQRVRPLQRGERRAERPRRLRARRRPHLHAHQPGARRHVHADRGAHAVRRLQRSQPRAVGVGARVRRSGSTVPRAERVHRRPAALAGREPQRRARPARARRRRIAAARCSPDRSPASARATTTTSCSSPARASAPASFATPARRSALGLEAALSGEAGVVRWYASYTLLRATFETDLDCRAAPTRRAQGERSSDGGGVIAVHKGDRIPGLPTHAFKAGVMVSPLPRLTLGLSTIAQSSQPFRGDEANLVSPVRGYVVLNAHAGYQLFDMLQLVVKAQNLLNNQVRDVRRPGRPERSPARHVGPALPEPRRPARRMGRRDRARAMRDATGRREDGKSNSILDLAFPPSRLFWPDLASTARLPTARLWAGTARACTSRSKSSQRRWSRA